MKQGFTLIELMVALVIVAIILTIAVPSYRNYVSQSRRSDAKTALLDLASREERYFSTNNKYSATPSDVGYAGAWPASIPTSTQVNYALSISAATATAFSATAVPQGSQASDPCGTYTINNFGQQGNTGNSLTSAKCW